MSPENKLNKIKIQIHNLDLNVESVFQTTISDRNFIIFVGNIFLYINKCPNTKLYYFEIN